MAYSTLADLKRVLPSERLETLTDDPELGQIDEDVITEAIAQADSEIDTYLGGRYDVPLTTVPNIIRRCSGDIAIYILYKRLVEEIPDARRGAYKDALRVLERINAGKLSLPEVTAPGDIAFGVLVTSHFGDDDA